MSIARTRPRLRVARRSTRRRPARIAGRPARAPVRVASHRDFRAPAGHRTIEVTRRTEHRRPSRLRLALVVWWRGVELDRRLAAGENPSSSHALGLRAARITSPRQRARVANGLAGARRSAANGHHAFTAAVRPNASDVLEARALIATIERRLCAPEPVDPRGVAIVRSLLVDGNSPLYRPWDPGALGSRLRAAAAALAAPV